MNPTIFNAMAGASQRLAPVLARIMSRGGSFATPFWRASQVDFPMIDSDKVQPAPKPGDTPQVPISGDNSGSANYSAGASPQDRLQAAFDAFKNKQTITSASAPEASPFDTMQWPFGPVGAPSQAEAKITTPAQGVPVPTPRPAEAPQAQPDTSFFMRNALMQKDPTSGDFIDPTGAASVRGPDLISKMMGYLNTKMG